MSDKANSLESLIRLAREDSSEGRQKLLHEITDMFMAEPEALSETEVGYFGDIMGKIAADVESKVRQHLSETIAAVPNAPHDLVHSLANDEIAVAMPVLTESSVLTDEDLVDIVGKHSQAHLQAISQRATVSETVTDALVQMGDDNVLGTLAENQGARFSRGGMETMVERAQANEELNSKLIKRRDVPDDLNQEMFWRVSWAMREQILANNSGMSEAQIEALMAETEEWFAAQQNAENPTPAEKFINRKEKMNQLDAALLLNLMRQQKVPEVVAGLARLAKLDLDVARQAIFDPSGEKLVIICRALEMDRDVFWEICDLANFDDERTPEDMQELLGVYERITPASAQRALRFLRTRLSVQERAQEGG